MFDVWCCVIHGVVLDTSCTNRRNKCHILREHIIWRRMSSQSFRLEQYSLCWMALNGQLSKAYVTLLSSNRYSNKSGYCLQLSNYAWWKHDRHMDGKLRVWAIRKTGWINQTVLYCHLGWIFIGWINFNDDWWIQWRHWWMIE